MPHARIWRSPSPLLPSRAYQYFSSDSLLYGILQADPKLGFLDGFVAQAVANGAQTYLPKGQRPDELDIGTIGGGKASGHALNFAQYEKAQAPQPTFAGGVAAAGPESYSLPSPPAAESNTLGGGLNMSGVVNKWGAAGFNSGGGLGGMPTGAAPAAPQPSGMASAPACGGGGAVMGGGGSMGAPMAPPAPRELTEKEKMAQAIFGGMAARTAPAPAPAPAPMPVAAPSSVPTPAPSMGAAPVVVAEAPPKEKKKKKKSDVGAASTSGGQVDLIGDLLGDLSAPAAPGPAATPQAVATAPPPGVGLGGDLLSLLDGPATPSAAATPNPMPNPMMMMGGVANVMSTPTIVPAMQLPPTADTVASDAFIKVLGQTTALPDRTEVKLFLQCTTSAGVRNVSLQLEPPPALRATLTATPPAEARGNRVTLSMLGAGLASTTASITCIGPLLFDLALQVGRALPVRTE